MRILRLNHSVYQLEYHLVWGTKYRMKLLKPYVKKTLLPSFGKTEFLYPTLHIAKVNTAEDHVHMMVEIAPSVSIAAMVQNSTLPTHFHAEATALRNRLLRHRFENLLLPRAPSPARRSSSPGQDHRHRYVGVLKRSVSELTVRSPSPAVCNARTG